MSDETPQPKKVQLPKSGNASQTVTVLTSQSLIIVGANGTGKTRLGIWLDEHSKFALSSHRISASAHLISVQLFLLFLS